MNKKGQLQVIGAIFGLIIFIPIWAIGLAPVINDAVYQSITANHITGVMAFLLAYMNLWILLFVLLIVSMITSPGADG